MDQPGTFYMSTWKNTLIYSGRICCRLIIFLLLSNSNPVKIIAQSSIPIKIINDFHKITSDTQRLVILEKLSSYYFAIKDETIGDSIIKVQIMMAFETGKPEWIYRSLFGNPGFNASGKSTKIRSLKTREYVQLALDYAKTNGRKDFEAIALAKLAQLQLYDGLLDDALNTAQYSYTTAMNTDNDSAIVICQLQLGDVYLQKDNLLMAFKSYSIALDLAISHQNENLKSLVLHAIALLYKNKLDEYGISKDYVFQSLELNKKNKNYKYCIKDYIALGKLFDYEIARNYLLKAEDLATKTNDYAGKIEAQRILFFYILLKEKPAISLSYVESHPELKNVFHNTGPNYFDQIKALIYSYSGYADTALVYFKRAENAFKTYYDPITKKDFFLEYTICMLKQKDSSQVIPYAEQLFTYSKQVDDYKFMIYSSDVLQKVYSTKGEFKKAFYYSTQRNRFKDTLELLSRDKELALLEIENENKRRKAEAEFKATESRRRYNLQYLLITVVIATLFILLILIGMFKVSRLTIRTMGFLSLIFLFEFIILLLDKWIHGITHGEPWQVWLIKIAIISVMLPMHHTFEDRLVHYLLSKKLIRIRSRLSLSNLLKLFKRTQGAGKTGKNISGDFKTEPASLLINH